MTPLVEKASAGAAHDGAAGRWTGTVFYSFDIDKMVPPDHLVWQIDGLLDLSWVHRELAPFLLVHGSALD
jgi:hypothetical protein